MQHSTDDESKSEKSRCILSKEIFFDEGSESELQNSGQLNLLIIAYIFI